MKISSITKIIILITISSFFLIIAVYVGLSLYITNLAFQVKINLPETNPEEYNIEFEEIEFLSKEKEEITLSGFQQLIQKAQSFGYMA